MMCSNGGVGETLFIIIAQFRKCGAVEGGGIAGLVYTEAKSKLIRTFSYSNYGAIIGIESGLKPALQLFLSRLR
jgi:hypothetical protein